MLPSDQIVMLAQMYHGAYRQKESAWFEKAAVGNPIQCELGCTHCCYQLPLGSLVTGVLIADRLRLAPEGLRAIEAQGAFQERLWLEHGPERAAEVYFQDHHQPCALLDPFGRRCTVYDLRPPACSSYYVVSDPGLCERVELAATIVGSLDNNALHLLSLQSDSAFAAMALQDPERGGDLLLGPLGSMVKAGRLLLEGDASVFDRALEVKP